MSIRTKAAALTVIALISGGTALSAAPASAQPAGGTHQSVAQGQQAESGPLSAQAYRCNYRSSGGYFYAGYYSGNSVTPSAGGVSNAGIEAQCLLLRTGYNPGTIDGIFGTNSKRAMRNFQAMVNREYGAGLSVDGLPGPQSWPWLRWYANDPW
ncbi:MULTISPECIES: peptidoglycan-binding protein [Streptomyces]|uniref:Peptidoglycan-binding protein n=1 Tax=Streptomyces lycii TaxID=2654337 RepID=A0ABQ7FB93_9ACTN|nr:MULTISPECIES: peptidoglycan-binding domain-containing protein [Streptomyces]KAF4405865.1 peptidoglycan-binding protein [Streptomyces lycii]PGH47100.1 hypothetical protein CRI70_30405 [Streptomyces sp. Ru87]